MGLAEEAAFEIWRISHQAWLNERREWELREVNVLEALLVMEVHKLDKR